MKKARGECQVVQLGTQQVQVRGPRLCLEERRRRTGRVVAVLGARRAGGSGSGSPAENGCFGG